MTPHNDFFLDAGPSVPPPLLPPSPVLSDALPSYPPPRRWPRHGRGGALGRLASPSPAALRPAGGLTRSVPAGPACGGCTRVSVPSQPAPQRPTRGRDGSRACGNTAALTSNRAARPPKRHTARARSPAWPSRPRPWALRWCPARRRAHQRPSGRAAPPRTPPRPGTATCRKGGGAGRCPTPYDHPSPPATVALQR
jgi:hypothetical protein